MSNSTEETLLLKGVPDLAATGWSPDGRVILFTRYASATRNDVYLLPLTGPAEPKALLQTSFNEQDAVFSPDGRWISYTTDESGQSEVYIQSFPEASSRTRVSTSGGFSPYWRGDGKEVFFVGPGGRLMATEVKVAGSALQVGSPKELFEIPGEGLFPARDGQRFLTDVPTEDPGSSPLTVVFNWTRELPKR